AWHPPRWLSQARCQLRYRPDPARPVAGHYCRSAAAALRSSASLNRRSNFGAHVINYSFVIRGVKNGGTGHEHIGTGGGNFTNIIGLYAAIDFQPDIAA